MSIRRRDHVFPSTERTPASGSLQDLLLSAAFLACGPVLMTCGAAILSAQPDLLVNFGEIQGLAGIGSAEALLGLLAAAAGLLVSVGAGLAVLAVLTQQIACRCGAWRLERQLAQFSPGFLRRGAALALSAGIALSATAADSWTRTIAPESVSVVDARAAGLPDDGASDGTSVRASDRTSDRAPDSALFDTAAPQDPPRTEQSTPGTPIFDRFRDRPQRRGSEPEQVVVRPGDSLWHIAADHLGSDATDWEIAASWPQWYELNRDRIGADPGIILPGTILDAPG